MKRICVFFISLFLFCSISKLYSQETNVSLQSQPNTNIYNDTINVIAGETINLQVEFIENSPSYFKSTTGKDISLDLNLSSEFTGVIEYDQSTVSNIPYFTSGTGTSTNHIKYQGVVIDAETFEDTIFINDISVKIPNSISGETFFVLRFTEDLSAGAPVTDTLLTFHYQKPQIEISLKNEDGPQCIGSNASCILHTIPSDLEYDIYIDNTQQGTVTGSKEITLGYGKKIYVKDKNNTDNYANSDTITFTDLTFFKGISLSGYNGETICEGSEINLTLSNESCDLSGFSYELFLDNQPIPGSLYEMSGTSIIYKPTSNGTITLKATKGDIVLVSNPITINSYHSIPQRYELYPQIRIPKENGEINLFNRFKDTSFIHTDTAVLNINGLYSSPGEDYYYFTNSNPEDTVFAFGRFTFNYDSENHSANSFFNPAATNVNLGEASGNEVWFHYGNYYGNNTYCFDSTKTNIKVITSEIFIPQASYCSDDSIADKISISTDPKYLYFKVDEDHTSESSYLGYAIFNQYGDTIQKGISTAPYFSPANLWSKRRNPLSTSMYVEVVALAKVIITTKPDSCPAQWDPEHGGPQPIYPANYYVNYMHNEYRSTQPAYADDIPGISDVWEDLGSCNYIIIKDSLYPIERYNTFQGIKENKSELLPENQFVPIGHIIWDCNYDTWNDIGNPQPIYNIDDEVTHLGKIYRCISPAYSYHVPDDYVGTIWDEIGLCGGGSDTLIITNDYASETFYINQPKTDGTIINLPAKFCPAKDSILLKSNYTIDTISGNGVSLFNFNNNEYFYYSYAKAHEKKASDSLILRYIDNNGCSASIQYDINIDPEYAVNKSGSIYWKQNNNLLPLDTNFCEDSYLYELSILNDFTIDSITGPGIDTLNHKYRFNPYNVSASDIILNLYYTDNATQCPYTYSHPVNISANHVDNSSGLLFLDDMYCAVNEKFELKTLNNHSFDSITSLGIKGTSISNLTYNPFTALENNGGFTYSADTLIDSIKVYFYDNRNCRYIKEYTTTIIGTKANQQGGLINLDDAYCKHDEAFELASTFTIDSIQAKGIDSIGGKWYLNPSHQEFIDNPNDETIQVKYYYRDGNNCAWYKDYSFDMYSRPSASFTIDNTTLCFNDTTAFINTSTFNNSSGSSLVYWEWDFGNGLKLTNPAGVTAIAEPQHDGRTFGSYISPKHVYKNHGVYPVSMKLTTDKGCYHMAYDTVVVGNYPEVEFTFDGQVLGSPTQFVNQTSTPDYDAVLNYTWNFDDPANVNSLQNNMNESVSYTFSEAGVHNVSLTAVSHNNCITDTMVKIPVFPYIVVDNNANYFETFNNSEVSGWLPAHSYDKGLPSGWKLSPVEGAFNSYPNTSGIVWLTGVPGDGITNEQSWVESPCFDISGLDFPLLSVDIFQSVEQGRDGAVVQYTLDDGKTWNLLSNGTSLEGGLNWYNQMGVVSNPGSQTGTGNMGWSENTGQWQTARFPLDELRQHASETNAACVRFRIAYSSDAGNVQSDDLKGFAFDNFVLSGRTRIVMMEQFINSVYDSPTQKNEENWLNSFVSANPNELVDIRYHNFISHDYDPLFYINPPDISARSMEYGATMNQLTMVDGIYRCIAPSENEAKAYYNLRTLTDKRFDIDVTTNLEDDKLNITANITKLTDTLTTSGSQKCVVRMAIVQKEYVYEGNTYHNVLVELLPNGEGNVVATIPATMAKGETITAHGSWEPNVTTMGHEFKLVVYVQGIWGVDEIHQVWFTDPVQVPELTIAAPEEINVDSKSMQFSIYPSPVKDVLNISWAEELENPVQWKLISVSGIVVKEGVTPAGQLHQVINTGNINGGIYLLITENPANQEIAKHKVLIVD